MYRCSTKLYSYDDVFYNFKKNIDIKKLNVYDICKYGCGGCFFFGVYSYVGFEFDRYHDKKMKKEITKSLKYNIDRGFYTGFPYLSYCINPFLYLYLYNNQKNFDLKMLDPNNIFAFAYCSVGNKINDDKNKEKYVLSDCCVIDNKINDDIDEEKYILSDILFRLYWK